MEVKYAPTKEEVEEMEEVKRGRRERLKYKVEEKFKRGGASKLIVLGNRAKNMQQCEGYIATMQQQYLGSAAISDPAWVPNESGMSGSLERGPSWFAPRSIGIKEIIVISFDRKHAAPLWCLSAARPPHHINSSLASSPSLDIRNCHNQHKHRVCVRGL